LGAKGLSYRERLLAFLLIGLFSSGGTVD